MIMIIIMVADMETTPTTIIEVINKRRIMITLEAK